MDPTTAALEKEHEAITKIKYIDKIQIGISFLISRFDCDVLNSLINTDFLVLTTIFLFYFFRQI